MSEAPAVPAVESIPAELPPPAGLPGEGSPLGTSTDSAPVGADTSTAPEPGADTLTAPEPVNLVTPETQFTLPDTVSVDDATMGAFRDFAIAQKLPTEAAQAALTMHIEALNRSAEAFSKAQTDAWAATTDVWKTELQKIPEFSGDRMAASQTIIGKALDTYGTPETRQAFELTGAGWNPAIVQCFYKMALALSEGTPIQAGGPPGSRNRTLAETLYPPKES